MSRKPSRLETSSQHSLGAGVVPVPGTAGAPLTPEQKRFKKLSTQVETARATLERFREGVQRFNQQQQELTRPVIAEWVACREVLLRAMEAFLGAQKLSPTLRSTLSRSIAEEAAELIDMLEAAPAAWLVELHDRHAKQAHAEHVHDEKLSMQSMLAQVLGEDLGDELLSDEELARKLAQAVADKAQRAEDSASSEGPAPGSNKGYGAWGAGAGDTGPARGRKPSRQKQQADEAVQFTQSVREVYRKLASALHPDRAPEGPKREAMTALMQQANQAYEAHNLLALLDLQAQLDSHSAGNATQRVMGLSAATLRHYNHLLSRELDELRMALDLEKDGLMESSPYVDDFIADRPALLSLAIERELIDLRRRVRQTEAALKALSDPASGRRWIKNESQRHRDEERLDRELDDFLGDLLSDLPEDLTADDITNELDDDPDNPFATRPRRRGPRRENPF